MKLTFFFVVVGFCYCMSYEAVDDNPGDRELARMAGQSYNDLGQVQIERDSDINTPNMDQFLLKIKDKKIKDCPATTGGCHFTPNRVLGGNDEYDPSLDPAIFNIVKRIKNIGCTEKTSDCAIILGRYLRSDSKQSKHKHVQFTRKMGYQDCEEKTGGCSYPIIRLKKPYYYQDKTLKKNTDSSPDYVNLDARYFSNDYQN